MRLLARAFGRTFLILAGMAFTAGAALFVIGSYLVTWPILRLPPRERRIQAGLDAVSSIVGAAMALKPPDGRQD